MLEVQNETQLNKMHKHILQCSNKLYSVSSYEVQSRNNIAITGTISALFLVSCVYMQVLNGLEPTRVGTH